MSAESAAELKRRSRKAEVISPKPAPRFDVARSVRRLRRQAPLYAFQGLNELSTRLRDATGREVIDMGRVMELAQFAYRQRELARRGPDYAVDEFGFDAQWTESMLPLFKILYDDYWRVETTTGQRFWLFRNLSDGVWHLHGEF